MNDPEPQKRVMDFSEAQSCLLELLRSQGWPQHLAWLACNRVLALGPEYVALFRPETMLAERSPHDLFNAICQTRKVIHIRAIAFLGQTTYVTMTPIQELAQGESMFVERGSKISMPTAPPRVMKVNSGVLWWLLSCQSVVRSKRLGRALVRFV
jgi:hypothetical protein